MPRVITIVAGHRRGRQDDGRTSARATRTIDGRPTTRSRLRRAVRRDLHALHAPRLPRALRRGRRALHLPVPRRRLRLHRQASPAARPCARSTASTPASRDGQVEIGPRYSVNSEFRRFPSYRDPAQTSTASASTCIPAASRPPSWSRLGHAQAPAPAASRRAAAQAQAPGRGRARQAARPGQGGRDPRRRLDRRAHVAVGRPALDDVPQGPEGDELVLHAGLGDDVRLPLAGGDGRVPGDVLRPVGHAARTSRRATSPTRSSSASSCAGCTSGARP